MNVPFPAANMGAPNCEFYPQSKVDVRVLFDLRIPGAAQGLHRERALWQERSDIEAVDEDHFALTVRPGWVSEPKP
jgi:hypothetical protein